MGLRRVYNGKQFVKMCTGRVKKYAWLVSRHFVEDGTEVNGIASKKVTMHIVQSVLNLRVNGVLAK